MNGACWSRVLPTHVPNPELRLWSKEVGGLLKLQRGDEVILGGNQVVEGMDYIRNVMEAINLEIGQTNLVMVER